MFLFRSRNRPAQTIDRTGRVTWRMPPLNRLAPLTMTPLTRVWMVVLGLSLLVAGGLVLARIIQLATAR